MMSVGAGMTSRSVIDKVRTASLKKSRRRSKHHLIWDKSSVFVDFYRYMSLVPEFYSC